MSAGDFDCMCAWNSGFGIAAGSIAGGVGSFRRGLGVRYRISWCLYGYGIVSLEWRCFSGGFI